jgi:hypothetical protein
MLLIHLPLILSAQGLEEEAKLVGLAHRERSQPWAAMPTDEVASFPSQAGLPLGQSRSQERASPFRAKFGLSTSWTGRIVAHAVSHGSTALVSHAIMFGTQHFQSTDEVPRRLVSKGQVSPGYKSHTKGLGHASETGRASPQPRLKGCQQRQSRGLCGRLAGFTCSERQNLRVPRRLFRSMRSVSAVTAATKWPGGTSSCQPTALLSNNPLQPEAQSVAVGRR